MVSVRMMRTDRIRARLYDERKVLRPVGSPEGTPGVEIPAGHWAVYDGRDTYPVAADVFDKRFVKMGSHYGERSKRIVVDYDEGVFSILGLPVPTSDITAKCAWCDEKDEPFAFASDPLDAVLSAAVTPGRKAMDVVEILGDMRARLPIDAYTDEMSRFDAIWTRDIVLPVKSSTRYVYRDPFNGKTIDLGLADDIDSATMEKLGFFLPPRK
jgi:hypothetical protein